MRWTFRDREIRFDGEPRLMGIVNVTPDSFSDGGRWLDPDAAFDRAVHLVEDGADLLDIGGESTRPGAESVDADEELRRVVPVIERLIDAVDVPISIDTSKAVVAREAIAAGASIINDVTGLQGDPEMVATAVETGAGVCIMHMRGAPRTMQDSPEYGDVVREVIAYLEARCEALERAGVASEAIVVDPGIGFGKTLDHNLSLLREVDEFRAIGRPLLIGHSRKSFIGAVLEDVQRDRTGGTLGVAVAMAARGVEILRVHDVAPVRDAIRLYRASGGPVIAY